MASIKQVSIIPSTNQITINGLTFVIDDLSNKYDLKDIHAIQWDGINSGHIEYNNNKKPVLYFNSDYFMTLVEPYIKLWEAKKKYDTIQEINRFNSLDTKINNILNMRERELEATDYLVLPDYTGVDLETKNTLLEYRQWLRDITEMPGFPWDGGGKETPWHSSFPQGRDMAEYYKQYVSKRNLVQQQAK